MLPLSIKDDEYKPPKFNLVRKVSGWISLERQITVAGGGFSDRLKDEQEAA